MHDDDEDGSDLIDGFDFGFGPDGLSQGSPADPLSNRGSEWNLSASSGVPPGAYTLLYPVAVLVSESKPYTLAVKLPGAQPVPLTISESESDRLSSAISISITYIDAIGLAESGPVAES